MSLQKCAAGTAPAGGFGSSGSEAEMLAGRRDALRYVVSRSYQRYFAGRLFTIGFRQARVSTGNRAARLFDRRAERLQ
ncbi:hypothetical protein DIE14_33405 [Burkholderia sp. Bp9017]|nr:hypothetical protein DIE14_33405 [Burkholderia sp. Bp9017]RQZ26777.1 hypothetical protein DIE13_30115 [Burkholderia sp. Bp9016]